jgi:hypothetical protein
MHCEVRVLILEDQVKLKDIVPQRCAERDRVRVVEEKVQPPIAQGPAAKDPRVKTR